MPLPTQIPFHIITSILSPLRISRTLNSHSPGVTFKDIFNDKNTNKKHWLWFLYYSFFCYNDQIFEVGYCYVEKRLVQLIVLDVKEKNISSVDDHSRWHHRDRNIVRWSHHMARNNQGDQGVAKLVF